MKTKTHTRVCSSTASPNTPNESSIVPTEEWEAFHYLFPNMKAEEIVRKINTKLAHEDLTKLPSRVKRALSILWRKEEIKDLNGILQNLNDKWLHSSCKIKVTKKPFLTIIIPEE